MQAPFPQDEARRLEALQSCGLLDSPPDLFLDALVVTVARSFRVPICLVSLVDENRQWFKAKFGLAEAETPRGCSFCAHLLWWPEPLVVCDAAADERFRDNLLVVGEPRIRFYAGVPLHARGVCVGSLCLIDRRPRMRFGDAETRILAGAASAVEERMIALTSRANARTDRPDDEEHLEAAVGR